MPPLPIVVIEQDGEILTEDKPDYYEEAAASANTIFLKSETYPSLAEGSAAFESAPSWPFGDDIVRTQWLERPTNNSTDDDLVPTGAPRVTGQIPEGVEGALYERILLLTNANGLSSSLYFGAKLGESLDCVDAVLMPDGARVLATEEHGDIIVRRLNRNETEGGLVVTLPGLSLPRLAARGGVVALLAHDKATNNLVMLESYNGGAAWK